jgi:hypothetical protein
MPAPTVTKVKPVDLNDGGRLRPGFSFRSATGHWVTFAYETREHAEAGRELVAGAMVGLVKVTTVA